MMNVMLAKVYIIISYVFALEIRCISSTCICSISQYFFCTYFPVLYSTYKVCSKSSQTFSEKRQQIIIFAKFIYWLQNSPLPSQYRV